MTNYAVVVRRAGYDGNTWTPIAAQITEKQGPITFELRKKFNSGEMVQRSDRTAAENGISTWIQKSAYWQMGDVPIDKWGVEDMYPDEVSDAPVEKSVYRIWRPRQVFEKFSYTFCNVPLFDEHPQLDEILIGTDANQPVAGTTSYAWCGYNDSDKYLMCQPILWKPSMFDIIRSGKKCEMSIGALMSYDWDNGTTPEGESYDLVLREIFGLHVAIVPEGRAGHDVKISRVRRDRLKTEGSGIMSIKTIKEGKTLRSAISREEEMKKRGDDDMEEKTKREDDDMDDNESEMEKKSEKAKREDDDKDMPKKDSEEKARKDDMDEKKAKREEEEMKKREDDDMEEKSKREDDSSAMNKSQRSAIAKMIERELNPLRKELSALQNENKAVREAREKLESTKKLGELVLRSSRTLGTPDSFDSEAEFIKAVQIRTGNKTISTVREADIAISVIEGLNSYGLSNQQESNDFGHGAKGAFAKLVRSDKGDK